MSDFSTRLDDAGRSATEPSLRLGKLAAPVHGSSLKSLFSNLRDFLVEQPVKVKAGTPTAFDMPKFGTGVGGNLKEFFHAAPRGPVNSALLVNWREEPGLWQNLRDLIAPRKLPPLKTTSQPIPVPEIWSKNTQFSRMQVISILVHVVAIGLIVIVPIMFPGIIPSAVTKAFDPGKSVDVTVSPFLSKLKPAAEKAGGGGGAHDKAPATKGKAPKFSWTQISAPIAHPPEHPQLPVAPTILGNPDIKMPNLNATTWGDPLAKANTGSMGEGHGTGIGNGNGAGLGPGEGWNTGGGLPYAGAGGYGNPACYYKPAAEYTDQAMKVKIQGSVELAAVVTADGRVVDPHVAKGLGYGLDEKAIETVRTWRCTPARGPDGKPAAVRVVIEAVFQLF